MVTLDYRSLYEALPNPVLVSDAKTGVLLDCNPSLFGKLGVSSRAEAVAEALERGLVRR